VGGGRVVQMAGVASLGRGSRSCTESATHGRDSRRYDAGAHAPIGGMSPFTLPHAGWKTGVKPGTCVGVERRKTLTRRTAV
jgi:hypothetical protein